MEGSHILDIITKLTPLIIGILVTGVGALFTHLYNFQHLQLNQITALEKMRSLLTSESPEDREFAYSAFVTLGYEEMAIRIIQLKKDQSGRVVLEQLQNTGDRRIRTEANKVLQELKEAIELVKRFEFGDAALSNEQQQVIEKYAVDSHESSSRLGIKTKLGKAVINDMFVHHGPGRAKKFIDQTIASAGSTPAAGADEKVWIRELLQIRKNANYPSAVKNIVRNRVAQLEKLADSEDWNLETIAEGAQSNR